MNAAAPGRLPVLLAATARVLEQIGPLPPATVTCDPATRFLPPVTLTPASPAAPAAQQRDLVHTAAARMGWPVSPLDGGDGAIADGTVDGIRVQALAAPLRSAPAAREPAEETPRASGTAEHAALLRALTDWAAALRPRSPPWKSARTPPPAAYCPPAWSWPPTPPPTSCPTWWSGSPTMAGAGSAATDCSRLGTP
ncbi:hypothetical protein [Actinomadura sp. 21ATH]|uniref:hypothetical protein n=1 Tax=Actinomadura sp. 21ATH TaxID=1735444 RepID=UPI0035C15636